MPASRVASPDGHPSCACSSDGSGQRRRIGAPAPTDPGAAGRRASWRGARRRSRQCMRASPSRLHLRSIPGDTVRGNRRARSIPGAASGQSVFHEAILGLGGGGDLRGGCRDYRVEVTCLDLERAPGAYIAAVGWAGPEPASRLVRQAVIALGLAGSAAGFMVSRSCGTTRTPGDLEPGAQRRQGDGQRAHDDRRAGHRTSGSDQGQQGAAVKVR